jgi:hypothetical protein
MMAWTSSCALCLFVAGANGSILSSATSSKNRTRPGVTGAGTTSSSGNSTRTGGGRFLIVDEWCGLPDGGYSVFGCAWPCDGRGMHLGSRPPVSPPACGSYRTTREKMIAENQEQTECELVNVIGNGTVLRRVYPPRSSARTSCPLLIDSSIISTYMSSTEICWRRRVQRPDPWLIADREISGSKTSCVMPGELSKAHDDGSVSQERESLSCDNVISL